MAGCSYTSYKSGVLKGSSATFDYLFTQRNKKTDKLCLKFSPDGSEVLFEEGDA